MYMNRYIILIAVAALLSAGCSKIEPAIGNFRGTLVIMPVLGTSTKGALTTIPTTRTLYVAAYYNASEGVGGNYFDFSPFRYNAEEGGWQGESRYWPQGGNLDMLSYSTGTLTPTSLIPGNNVSEEVTLRLPSNAADQEDIIAGAATGVSGSASIAYVHAQSLLTFRVGSATVYNGTANRGFTLRGVQLVNAAFGGTLKIRRTSSGVTCDWSDLGSRQDMPVYSGMMNLSTLCNEVGSSVLLPSQQACAVKLTYVMHNGPAGNLDMEYTFTPAVKWAAARHYIYDITLTAERIVVTTTLQSIDDDSHPFVIDIREYDIRSYLETI